MRPEADLRKLERLLERLGRKAKGPGRIYLVGGASALLKGWRDSTVDIDLKLDPEPAGIFEAIAEIKRDLDVNIELSAPDQFLPEVPGWRDRSPLIARHGEIDFFHYDFRAQALSKIARYHNRDRIDVEGMLASGLITAEDLRKAFEQIEPDLPRFPSLDLEAFTQRLRTLTGS